MSDVSSGNYQLDNKHTALLFKVNHLGFSSFVGRFEEVSATLSYNPEQPELSSLRASANMASVNVNNETFENTLRNRFWLNTQKFPTAHYQTRSAKRTGANHLLFDGELTFLGVTKPLNLAVTINGAGMNRINGEYTLGVSATGTVIRSEHGLGLFTPAIGDDVTLEIHAEFIRNQ
tara:strand:+ start:6224 stop:6751 length:528 start_codon:yes stop_codon:yes gene_type:complete